MNSHFNKKEVTAIHEAAHAVFGCLLRVPTKNLYLFENDNQGKSGEMIPIIDRRYDVLSISLTDYLNPNIQEKTINATKSMLFVLIAGNCAENIYQKQHPDYPPDLRIGSDGCQCYNIIERLCQYHKKPFDRTKFNQIYFLLLDTINKRFKSDKHLLSIIVKLAGKLLKSKKGVISFGKIKRIVFGMIIWKIVFHKYKPYPFLEISLIEEIEK